MTPHRSNPMPTYTFMDSTIRNVLFLIWALLHAHMTQAQLPQVSSGRIERFTEFPSQFVIPRTIDVWLPDEYSADKKYAVLYLHDGQMLFDATQTWNNQEWQVDEIMGALIRDQKIRDCIVVGIWNAPERRRREYFPAKAVPYIESPIIDSLSRLEWQGQSGLADAYLSFIVRELKPFIDRTYSTHTDRANTCIGGSSFGGLISLYAMCEYPATFGGAMCLSTHWPGSLQVKDPSIPKGFLEYFKKHMPSAQYHKIYFDRGTETLDAQYAPTQERMDMIMRKKGYRPENFQSLVFEGDDHSEKAWAKRLNIPLTFLLSE